MMWFNITFITTNLKTMSVVLHVLPSHSKKSQIRCPTLPPVIVWIQRPTFIIFLLLLYLSPMFCRTKVLYTCTPGQLTGHPSAQRNQQMSSFWTKLNVWSLLWKSYEMEIWFDLGLSSFKELSNCQLFHGPQSCWELRTLIHETYSKCSARVHTEARKVAF